MRADLTQQLNRAIESLPAFPRGVQRVLDLTRDANATARDLVDVIDKDPVLTLRLLKVINSAYFGLPKQITAVSHAVVFLGFNTIKNMALGVAAAGMLPAHNEAGLDNQGFLLHALSTAALARQLARCDDTLDPSDAYIAGLLHDFGKVVLARAMPQALHAALLQSRQSGTPLHAALQSVLGTDHAEVGAMLAEKWRFAPQLVQAIAQHDAPTAAPDLLGACVFAANQLSKTLSPAAGDNPCIRAFPDWVTQACGGNLDALAAQPERWRSALDEAQLFAQA